MMVSDEQIIAGLLTAGTVKAAAKQCGLSERTIYNRMTSPDFQAAYKMAKADGLREAVKNLQAKKRGVYHILESIMNCTTINPDTRLRAAGMILEELEKTNYAMQAAEEQALKAMDSGSDFLNVSIRKL